MSLGVTLTLRCQGVQCQNVPARIFHANDGAGEFAPANEEFIAGPIPETILAANPLVGDFNGDGPPDIFIPDSGPDLPPYPGGNPVVLLSSEDG